jgi:hypothetical protein
VGDIIGVLYKKSSAIAHVDRERAEGLGAMNGAELFDGHA